MFLKKILAFISVCLAVSSLNQSFAQGATSNKGTDFWLAYGNHVSAYGNNNQRMSIYVTSDVNTTGTATFPGGSTSAFSVTANQITIIDVPQTAYIGNQEGKKVQGAIHVVAEKAIVVYAHIYDSNISGATLVLPTNTLGKEYYSINYTQVSNSLNSFSYFFVIAIEDNTQIEITPTAATQGGLAVGQKSAAITLNKGDIYQVLGTATSNTTGTDLTGSLIRSVSTTSEPCKKIAVFSGSGKIAIGCPIGNMSNSSDNLYQQVYPTATWGKSFVTVPLKSRNYDIYRIFKSDPTAEVTLNGSLIPPSLFVNGLYYDFPKQDVVNYISSDKPIQVVQYAVTQNTSIGCTRITESAGDPEMIYLNPLEQTLKNITMYSADAYRIVSHFINVVIKTEDVISFKLDGNSRIVDFLPVTYLPGYSYAQLSVSAGTHNLSADGGFNAIAYGFGNAESYGYSAGANLVSNGIQVSSVNGGNLKATGCVSEDYTLTIPLPYQAVKLNLDIGDGQGPRDIPIVELRTYVQDGVTYHVYELVKSTAYTATGTYQIQLLVDKPNSDGCGSTDQYDLDFTIYFPPDAGFTANQEVCVGSPLSFTDRTIDKGTGLEAWAWDFGDGTLSTDQNPVHTYTRTGVFIVKQFTTGKGCASDVFMDTIRVNALPVAVFNHSTPSCETRQVIFTDASTAADGVINMRTWDFGDGTAVLTDSLRAPVLHTFAAAGTYTVKLTITTDKGCVSVISSQTVVIYPQPVARFIMPDICLADKRALFNNTSTISDNSALTYLWDFGDPNATAANPNSSNNRNPTHDYIEARTYQVRLTVTSINGCIETIVQTFTVNGSIPDAKFNVQNPTGLCSNQPVQFQDLSTVDFGKVTKIEWYFDDGNPLVPVETDNTPGQKMYSHTYPALHYPTMTKTYNVRMVAYSGTSCFDVTLPTPITIKAVPVVLFDVIPPICAEKSPIPLTQGKETTGIDGTMAYSGPGVSASGLFNPSATGPGLFTLTCTFTASNGCIDQTTQTILVYPTPTVAAGKDQTLLEGNSTQFNPVAAGSNLTYKWFPSTGLDKDDILNPVASPTDDITYTLRVTSDQGCSISDQVFVKVLKVPLVPNTFTPNGDGINDLWNIKYMVDYPGATVVLYNRYGDKIFSSRGYTESWDGRVNGQYVAESTYYYIITPGNGRKTMYGSVTVVK